MQKRPLRIMYLTIFLDLLGFGLVLPYVPAVARALGANDSTAPLLGACFFLAQFLAIPFWGRLSDRVGRRPVFLASYAAASLAMLAYALAPTLGWAFAARTFAGLTAAHILMAQAMIADLVPAERRAKAMGIIGVAFGVGFLFGPPLGGALGELHLLRHPGSIPGLIWAGLSAINFLVVLFRLRESLPSERRRQAAVSTGAPGHLADVAAALRMPGVPVGLLVAFTFFFWFEGMQQTLANFTADRFGMGLRQTGLLLLWVGLVGAVIQGGLVHRLVRRFGEAKLITAGCLLEGVAMAMSAASPAPLFLFVAGLFGALGTGLMLPCSSSYVSRCADAQAQGVALGAMQSTTAVARILGPLMAGLLYAKLGPTGPYYVGGAGMVLAALFASRLRAQTPTAEVPVIAR